MKSIQPHSYSREYTVQEQTTARALMAESAAQSLSIQLKTQQDESCKSTQLLQALFASLAESCSSDGSISPACPQGAEPCSLNRQMTAGLPDQAKAQLVISHIQAVISSSAAQQQQLSMLTQQMERYSAESAAAKATLQVAVHALPHLKAQPADSSSALSHAVLLETPHSRQAEPDELSQLTELAQLADAVASALTGKQQDLLEVEMQAEQLSQHLRQAEAQVADIGLQAQASGAEVQALQQQLARAQAELQQVLNKPKTISQAGRNQFCMSVMHQYRSSRGTHNTCVMRVVCFTCFTLPSTWRLRYVQLVV